MLELEFLDGDDVEAYYRTNRARVTEYLQSKVAHVDSIGYFQGKVGPASVLYLVVIVDEECPCDPEQQFVAERISNEIFDALDAFYPLPALHPNHTLYTMIQNYVVVKRDPAAPSGFTKVWWPEWIYAPSGEYGG
ncbi:hypothetical protein Daesc_005895 [Daldinia eschscholtzii]|uniref:Uncharacterized protein n=1 Tax=Daldinia eschscholtzii TaxID=292717 RepID=A0AAX6MLP8_9PEZI